MRTCVLLILILLTVNIHGQSPCDKVKLYDQIILLEDQPIFKKLKRFDKKLIPDSTILQMKDEIVKITLPNFFSKLKIKSAKLYDTAIASYSYWRNEPIFDAQSNPVYFFYAIVFEITTNNGVPFLFRLDVLPNGKLLNKKQIPFFSKARLNIIDCKKITTLILADTIQPLHSIDHLALIYSPKKQAMIWIVVAVEDPNTGIRYQKDVNAITGAILRRTYTVSYTPTIIEKDIEKVE